MSSTLQLQRLAHQGVIGVGSWTGGVDDVPLTKAGEDLALLDLKDPNLPGLRPPANASAPMQVPQVSSSCEEIKGPSEPLVTESPAEISPVGSLASSAPDNKNDVVVTEVERPVPNSAPVNEVRSEAGALQGTSTCTGR